MERKHNVVYLITVGELTLIKDNKLFSDTIGFVDKRQIADNIAKFSEGTIFIEPVEKVGAVVHPIEHNGIHIFYLAMKESKTFVEHIELFQKHRNINLRLLPYEELSQFHKEIYKKAIDTVRT